MIDTIAINMKKGIKMRGERTTAMIVPKTELSPGDREKMTEDK
jgi:hypothetical protein